MLLEKRYRNTYLSIIHRQFEPGTTTHSEGHMPVATLNEYGFTNQTVNHSLSGIDPSTKAPTLSITVILDLFIKKKYGLRSITFT